MKKNLIRGKKMKSRNDEKEKKIKRKINKLQSEHMIVKMIMIV